MTHTCSVEKDGVVSVFISVCTRLQAARDHVWKKQRFCEIAFRLVHDIYDRTYHWLFKKIECGEDDSCGWHARGKNGDAHIFNETDL